jgi:hypothetical protein
MRRIGLVLAWIILIVSIASAVFGIADWRAQSVKRAASRCPGAPSGSCWVETQATIQDVSECGNAACNVHIAATVNGASLHPTIFVMRDLAAKLHPGDAATVRVLANDVLSLHTDNVVAQSSALEAGAERNSEWALALFVSLAIVSWFVIGRLHVKGSAPWTSAQWARFGYGALLVWGLVTLALFATIGGSTWPFVRDYRKAAACSVPAPDCRLRVTGEVVHKRCSAGWTWTCELALRYSRNQETRVAFATLLGEDTRSIHETVPIEAFKDEITRVFVDERAVTPENAPQNRMKSVSFCSAFAFGLICWAVFGLASLRQRMAGANRPV